MKITKIVQQQNNQGRYSVFIDGQYSFPLSEAALLNSKITAGQVINQKQFRELKLLSSGDKFYSQATRYVSIRPRTTWELTQYLQRKQAPPHLIKEILNKLSDIGLVDDAHYVKAYIHDRQLFRPTSRRKIIFELRKKHIEDDIIKKSLSDEKTDLTALEYLISRKREQTRYQDDLKLMQYLARQGFNYGDIKEALNSNPRP